MVNKFKNCDELFRVGSGYFWKNDIYYPNYKLGRLGSGKSEKVALYSEKWVVAVGIRAINRYMQVNNLQCEM